MSYGLVVTTPPAAEPIALADAKTQLNIAASQTADDALISWLIQAAREQTEAETNRCWMPRTLTMSLHTFPYHDDRGMRFAHDFWPGTVPGYFPCIVLPCEPVSGIVSLTYYDPGGTVRTLVEGTGFLSWLQHSPPVLYPFPGTLWPYTQTNRLGGVSIAFSAGYQGANGNSDPSAVPARAVVAMQMSISYWYEHRGDSEDPSKLGLPDGAVRILRSLHTGYYS